MDNRNVLDKFKNLPHKQIVAELDARGSLLEIAIENLERDFNMGTIVRSANAFGVRTVHIIGRRQWNKRGAMMTDTYLQVVYHGNVKEFVAAVNPRQVIAVDNVPGSIDMRGVTKQTDAVLVFGSEGLGISEELRLSADAVVMIPQIGSTRSLNVGVAAGIAIWEWSRTA